ncbi:hypothetical protein D3C85_1905900 [compost metagenome]
MPVPMACGCALVRSDTPEPKANTAPINAAPVINPRLRDRLSRPAITPLCCELTPPMINVLLAVWNNA